MRSYPFILFALLLSIPFSFADVLLSDCIGYTSETDNERYYLNADITNCTTLLWANAGYLNQEIDCQGYYVNVTAAVEPLIENPIVVHNCNFIASQPSGLVKFISISYDPNTYGTIDYYNNNFTCMTDDCIVLVTNTGTDANFHHNKIQDFGGSSQLLESQNDNTLDNVSFNTIIGNSQAYLILFGGGYFQYFYNNSIYGYSNVFLNEYDEVNLSEEIEIGNFYEDFYCNDSNENGFCDEQFSETTDLVVYDSFAFYNPAPIVPAPTLQESAVAYYTYDSNTTNSTTALDSTPNDADATINGDVEIGKEGIIGESNLFFGDDALISNPNIQEENDWSFTAWVKLNQSNELYHVIGDINDNTINEWIHLYTHTPPEYFLQMYCRDGSDSGCNSTNLAGWQPNYTNLYIPNMTWAFVTATFNSSSSIFTLCLDGSCNSTTWSFWNFFIGQLNLYVGYSINGDYGTIGYIDEVGVFNKTLSQNEIDLLYNEGLGCQYPFTDCPIPTNCTPNWVCLDYSDCQENDTFSVCIAVTDLAMCGESYTGDYSEFEVNPCNDYIIEYESDDLAPIAVDGIGKFLAAIVPFMTIIAIGYLVGFWVYMMKR
jgi:Concanavalin A-like lectin/glucanases superfamily